MYIPYTIPTLLTVTRLVLSPLLLPFLFSYFLPYNLWYVNGLLSLIFLLLGSTDFFDGYFARRYQLTNEFGKLLDPLADKFLLFSALLGLLAAQKIHVFWVVLLLGRELYIMGLREFAALRKKFVSVSWGGKIKTALQIIAIFIIILNPYTELSLLASRWNQLQFLFLSLATAVSFLSAFLYHHELFRSLYLIE